MTCRKSPRPLAVSCVALTCPPSDLLSIPNDLRLVLEECLGLQPSPAVFNHYIPQVRTVLFRLLQGLQKKQGPYWRAVEDVSPRWSVPVRWSR